MMELKDMEFESFCTKMMLIATLVEEIPTAVFRETEFDYLE